MSLQGGRLVWGHRQAAGNDRGTNTFWEFLDKTGKRLGSQTKTIESGSVKLPEKIRWIVEKDYLSYHSTSYNITEIENGKSVHFYFVDGGRIEDSQLESLKGKLPKSLWLEIKESNWDEFQGN